MRPVLLPAVSRGRKKERNPTWKVQPQCSHLIWIFVSAAQMIFKQDACGSPVHWGEQISPTRDNATCSNRLLQGDNGGRWPVLGWPLFVMFHQLAQLLSQFCQTPICLGRTRGQSGVLYVLLSFRRHTEQAIVLYSPLKDSQSRQLFLTQPESLTSADQISFQVGAKMYHFIPNSST